VERGKQLAMQLRDEHKVHMVIALTHMRSTNDKKLAKEVPEIDLILGGHDHFIEVVNTFTNPSPAHPVTVIKSGNDFRDLGIVELSFNSQMKLQSIQGTLMFKQGLILLFL
jgi:5'-nucleotidase